MESMPSLVRRLARLAANALALLGLAAVGAGAQPSAPSATPGLKVVRDAFLGVTRFDDFDVQMPSTDGRHIVFVRAGFLSHVQGDLKQKAHEGGCDMVLPRSAFSQNLPQLLRRHGAAEEETGVQ